MSPAQKPVQNWQQKGPNGIQPKPQPTNATSPTNSASWIHQPPAGVKTGNQVARILDNQLVLKSSIDS